MRFIFWLMKMHCDGVVALVYVFVYISCMMPDPTMLYECMERVYGIYLSSVFGLFAEILTHKSMKKIKHILSGRQHIAWTHYHDHEMHINILFVIVKYLRISFCFRRPLIISTSRHQQHVARTLRSCHFNQNKYICLSTSTYFLVVIWQFKAIE